MLVSVKLSEQNRKEAPKRPKTSQATMIRSSESEANYLTKGRTLKPASGNQPIDLKQSLTLINSKNNTAVK